MATASFAALLRQHRLALGLTQEELAERAGLSGRAISDLERGLKQAPRPSTVRLLVRGLGLPEAEAAALLRRGPATSLDLEGRFGRSPGSPTVRLSAMGEAVASSQRRHRGRMWHFARRYPTVSTLERAVHDAQRYLGRNGHLIPNYARRRRAGQAVSTAFVESLVNSLLSKRFAKRPSL